LFSALPFDPVAGEYLAWVYHGGGQELWQEILAPSDIVEAASGVFSVNRAPEGQNGTARRSPARRP
jgi:TRAP-type mannitol/chloroaromatic compound transport system substrate-binding protein